MIEDFGGVVIWSCIIYLIIAAYSYVFSVGAWLEQVLAIVFLLSAIASLFWFIIRFCRSCVKYLHERKKSR